MKAIWKEDGRKEKKKKRYPHTCICRGSRRERVGKGVVGVSTYLSIDSSASHREIHVYMRDWG